MKQTAIGFMRGRSTTDAMFDSSPNRSRSLSSQSQNNNHNNEHHNNEREHESGEPEMELVSLCFKR